MEKKKKEKNNQLGNDIFFNIMKPFIGILATMFVAGGVLSPVFAQTFEVDNIVYELTSKNTVRVKKLTSIPADGKCVIPASVCFDDANYEVTALADSVFYKSFDSITSVELPQNITDIGKCQFFDCTHLESLILPDKIETLHYGSVAQCDRLKYLHLPTSLKNMEANAMWHNISLRKIVLPETLEEAASGAIWDNGTVKTIVCNGKNCPFPFYSSLDKSVKVFVPYDAIETYKKNYGWNTATLVESIPYNEVVMNDVHACKGDEVDIVIALNNVANFDGISAELVVPKYCAVAKDEEGCCMVEAVGIRWRGIPVVKCWQKNYSNYVYTYYFEAYNKNLAEFTAGSGNLCRVTLSIPDDYRLWTTTTTAPYYTQLTNIKVNYRQGTNTYFVYLPDAESILYVDKRPEPNGIDPTEDEALNNDDVYTVTGTYVGKHPQIYNLPKGVYIIGRRKVFVK